MEDTPIVCRKDHDAACTCVHVPLPPFAVCSSYYQKVSDCVWAPEGMGNYANVFHIH